MGGGRERENLVKQLHGYLRSVCRTEVKMDLVLSKRRTRHAYLLKIMESRWTNLLA